MNLLHLDYAGKTARVGFSQLPEARPKAAMTQTTAAGPVSRVRLLNGLNPAADPFRLTADAVIDGDPELDFSKAGRRLDVELTAAYFDPRESAPRPLGDFKEVDVITDAAGAEKERRPHLVRSPNLDTMHPVKLLKRFPIREALTNFAFRQCYQLVHSDGLTMEFLHTLAADLHGKGEMALLGAGPKGNQPLVVREKGSPYRAFLYGEVRGDEYKLVVMLSDQELKKPAGPAAS